MAFTLLCIISFSAVIINSFSSDEINRMIKNKYTKKEIKARKRLWFAVSLLLFTGIVISLMFMQLEYDIGTLEILKQIGYIE